MGEESKSLVPPQFLGREVFGKHIFLRKKKLREKREEKKLCSENDGPFFSFH